MKIFCVGKNYRNPSSDGQSAAPRPQEPIIFLKPDSAYLHNGKPFFIPQFMGSIFYEGEIVVRIDKLGKGIATKFAHRYYSYLTIGVDFTAHELLCKAQQEGLPWDISKGFDGSATIGTWIEKSNFPDVNALNFRLDINGATVQESSSEYMLFSIDEIISYVSQFYTLRTGDLIFTGTPAGSAVVSINDRVTGYIEDKQLLSFICK